MIKLMVIGNLGKDCLVNTVNGKNVINFSVAHTEKFKDSSGAQREKTTWVECAYWTDRTGIAPYLKKGTQVYAEGSPEVRTYQTQDGKSGASLTIRVQSVQLLGSRAGAEGMPTQQPQSSYTSNSYSTPGATASDDINEASDDLPF
jgi:single-strand DNA-binding protein